MARGRWALQLCALALLAPAAHTQERAEAELSYAVDEGLACPEEGAFRDIVAARLGYDPFRDRAERRIDARIRRGRGGLVGRVEVKGADGRTAGSRQLDAAESECEELAGSLAIAVSILLDPFSAGGVAPAPPQPAKPPPKPPPPPPVECPEPPEPAPPPLRLLAGAELGASIGLTPGIAVGPGVTAGAWWNRWTFAAHGRADFTPVPVATDLGDVHAAVYSIGPRVCHQWGVGLGCVSAQAGIFQGRGVDLPVSRSATGSFFSGDVAAGLGLPAWTGTWLTALVEVRAPLSRTSLEIDGQTAWTAPPLAFGLKIGLFGALPAADDGNAGE